MKVITEYRNKADLKRKIIELYLEDIKRVPESNRRILSDKKWASSGSEFHNKCRADMELEISEVEKQTSLLAL